MSLVICPRCHTMLAAVEGVERSSRCDGCRGTFTRSDRDKNDSESDGEAADTVAYVETRPLSSDLPTLSCPHCLTHMQGLAASSEFDCPRCGGRWVDGDGFRLARTARQLADTNSPAPLPLDAGTADVPLSAFTKNLLYGISLPERLLRSGVGLTAGAVKEMAGLLVPQAFQSSKSYEIAIDNSLTFLTETIGGVRGPTSTEAKAGEHVARKAVGNFVDLAGLATLHVSPMWVLAAVSDIAYGSGTYVREVATELKAQGVIDDTSTIHQIDDVLDAIQRSSGSAASTFDRPPLSVEELRTTLDQIRSEVAGADLTKLLPEREVRRLWMEMQSVATQENVGLFGISSAITLRMLDEAKTVSSGALTSIRVVGGLFNRTVIGHYVESLDRIRQQGFYATLAESYRPYVASVWHNFAEERETWTEQLLDPNHITTAVNKLFSLLDGEEE